MFNPDDWLQDNAPGVDDEEFCEFFDHDLPEMIRNHREMNKKLEQLGIPKLEDEMGGKFISRLLK